ncbi:MAG: hypothetical protein J6P02_03825 [Lachnospiraceae bacterium]|nr:hypothetical protein [Lachnospiraceae bacterium]
MDNIILKKIYTDNELIEIEVIANNDFINARQTSYVNEEVLKDIIKNINNYLKLNDSSCYIEVGNKKGKCTPAFSMEFMKPNMYGHIIIEMDMEICDNEERNHRCKFYVKSEIGLVERFT